MILRWFLSLDCRPYHTKHTTYVDEVFFRALGSDVGRNFQVGLLGGGGQVQNKQFFGPASIVRTGLPLLVGNV